MKQRRITKKIGVLFLAAAALTTALPGFRGSVSAQEPKPEVLPIEQFATAEQLKSFNTNDKDGVINPARVYFGKDSQPWWIAGSQQEKGLTLFAARALADACFHSVAEEGEYNGQSVYCNHYGASDLRKTVQGLEISHFTGAEQGLMNHTTVYTNDMKNDTVYSIEDKLSLPYGVFWNEKYHVTVGVNYSDDFTQDMNTGLRVDQAYWGKDRFWLRGPYLGWEKDHALAAIPGSEVSSCYIIYPNKVLPAFELSLSSVLFASAAPAASTGDMTLQNTVTDGAFTLRHDADMHSKNLGSALVPCAKTKVLLVGVPSGTYLVVQDSEGAKAREITNETEVTASDMGVTSFANCKIWLEHTDTANRMTYATLAIEEEAAVMVGDRQYAAFDFETILNEAKEGDTIVLLKDVNADTSSILKAVNPDTYLNISKNINLNLNGKKLYLGSMKLNVNEGKKFHIINENNGKIVTDKKNLFGIYNHGLLTAKGSITCGVFNESSGRIKGGTYLSGVESYGMIEGGEFKGSNSFCGGVINGGSFKEEPILRDGAKYGDGRVLVKTDDGELPYKVVELAGTTQKVDGNDVIGKPLASDVGYKEGLTLKDVKLPKGWIWSYPETALSAGTKSYPAIFDTAGLEGTTDFSSVEGYDASAHKVIRNIEVKVNKAKNTWVKELSIKGWTYGEKANAPTAKAQFGEVTFTYSSEEQGTYTAKAPKNVGTHYVKASVAETENYTGLESVVSFTIAKKADSLNDKAPATKDSRDVGLYASGAIVSGAVLSVLMLKTKREKKLLL